MEKRRQLSFQIFEKQSLNSILIETERSMFLGNEEEFEKACNVINEGNNFI